MEIFCRNHSFPASKMLTLKRKEPFELFAYYKPDAVIPHTEFDIGMCCMSIFALDLLQVSLLINKQTGEKQKKKREGKGKGRESDLALLPFSRSFSSSSLPFVY